jgi:hypothetical protein
VEDEMSAEWDSGFMVRQPSWHRLEKAVLKQSPRTWEEARTLAGLDWEAETAPVYTLESVQPKPDGEELKVFRMLEGWQQIRRNDTQAVLSVRPESYRIIPTPSSAR